MATETQLVKASAFVLKNLAGNLGIMITEHLGWAINNKLKIELEKNSLEEFQNPVSIEDFRVKIMKENKIEDTLNPRKHSVYYDLVGEIRINAQRHPDDHEFFDPRSSFNVYLLKGFGKELDIKRITENIINYSGKYNCSVSYRESYELF